MHLAFAKWARHTTRAMEVLPADFAWVVYEVWRAWRVIGDSLAAASCCAGDGVCSCVCVIGLQLLCVELLRGSIKEKTSDTEYKTNSLLNRVWSCQARFTLKSVLSLEEFLLHRSHRCIYII